MKSTRNVYVWFTSACPETISSSARDILPVSAVINSSKPASSDTRIGPVKVGEGSYQSLKAGRFVSSLNVYHISFSQWSIMIQEVYLNPINPGGAVAPVDVICLALCITP